MTCDQCTAEGRRGYCAPLRCYCGHDTCHAYQSFITPTQTAAPTNTRKSRAANAWANREEPTWLDR